MNRTAKIFILAGVVVLGLAVVFLLVRPWGGVPDGSGGGAGGGTGDAAEMGGMDGMAAMEGGGGMTMDGSIRLSAGEVATFGVTFGEADVRPLVRTIRVVGMVEFDETRIAYVAPKFGGWVERLNVNFTGQAVQVGEPLLEVYSPELVSVQEELLLAAGMAEGVQDSPVADVAAGARELRNSARRRLEYWDISQDQVDRLLETGEVRRTLTLHAPVSGVVMEKNVFEGQAFAAGTELYMIADLSRVWINAQVFESDAGLIRPGMSARVTVEALPGETFVGDVEYVYPTLEERTRSLRARIALDNPEERLKPGMYATVRMRVDLREALTLPTSAVLYSGERAVAFVQGENGALLPRELELGMSGDDRVQVLSGVEAGERVVTSAQFLLDSESNLAEVMRGMMAQMNMSDMGGMDMRMGDPRPDSTGGR